MIASSAQLADDGRPTIEVTSLRRGHNEVSLEGTAIAYEGTVLFDVVNRDGTVLDTAFTTASAGGPSRGAWSITVSLPRDTATLVVREEEMEEGAASASTRRVVLPL